MPPYQQSYQETEEIERKTLQRDINILNQICKNKYYFYKADQKNLQVEGVDFIGIPKDNPLDTDKYIFIDRKTSNKHNKREWLIFELYFQYEEEEKKESWSLHRPYLNANRFLVVFIDKEQAISIAKVNMINSLRRLEKERPDLIHKHKEINRNGDPVDKYTVNLPLNHNFVKNMKPRIYHKKYKNGFEYFKRIE